MKQLTLRERVLLLNLALAVVWAGYFLLRYRPGRAELVELNRRAAALEKQKSKLTADLAALERQETQGPDPRELKRQLARLDRELARTQEQLRRWRRGLEHPRRTSQVQQLRLRFAQAARKCHLELVAWEPWRPAGPDARKRPARAPSARGGKTPGPAGSGKSRSPSQAGAAAQEPLPLWCRRQGCRLYRVKLRGSYSGTVRLLRLLEMFPPQVVALEVALTQQEQPQVATSALQVELLLCL